jgi:hypothetical protein
MNCGKEKKNESMMSSILNPSKQQRPRALKSIMTRAEIGNDALTSPAACSGCLGTDLVIHCVKKSATSGFKSSAPAYESMIKKQNS